MKGFRTLGVREREQIMAATREVAARKGQTLFREGQDADAVWAVKEGVIHIVKSGPDGKEIVVEVIAPGELFGAVAALQNRPYPASALAAEDTVVWCLPGSLARDLCQKYPALRSAILEEITARLRSAHDRLRSVALERVEQRLARMLLTLSDKIGRTKEGVTALSVTRQELADMIGTTVETTIRITSRWQSQGIIGSSRHEIRLTDLAALKSIAEGDR